jgi:glycosyltransferase involved in cell wall biosynthesis
MRIAFTVHKYPPESLGGTEIYTWSLARALARVGHQVHVFYPLAGISEDEGRGEREGVQLWRVPLPATRATENPAAQYWHTFRDTAIEAAFQTFLDEVAPAIVHFQHVQGVSARLIALAAGRPRVVTLHDYWYFCANSQLIRPDRSVCDGPGWGGRCVDCATARADLRFLQLVRLLGGLPFAYRNHYLRHLCDQVDLFVAPSRFLRHQYVDQGFPADRIIMLENGLDMQRLQALPDPPLAPPPVRPHFGFLGSLAWQKGVHILIDAFNQLPDEASLTIYGNQAVFPEYVAQLKSAVRHPHIRFAGQLDHRRVGAALRQMDCLVVPSLWYENSPVTIQEAFASGVPVIASRLGALAEKVQDSRTGRLFAAGQSDKLAHILREIVMDPAQLASLRANLRPGPTIEQHVQEVLGHYETLLRS